MTLFYMGFARQTYYFIVGPPYPMVTDIYGLYFEHDTKGDLYTKVQTGKCGTIVNTEYSCDSCMFHI